MHSIEARFRIVTPMYLGGADQVASSIRPPSVKGALRFWWRALQWGVALQANRGDELAALRALHQREAAVFGLAAADGAGGQGAFLLRVESVGLRLEKPAIAGTQAGLFYLRGMGLKERNALVAGEFVVRLLFRPGADEELRQGVAASLEAFGLLGALGSRARHGFGSVALESWSVADRAVPATRGDYAVALRRLLDPLAATLPGTEPPFSALSRLSRIDLSLTMAAPDPLELLDAVGREQQLYRSYGSNGTVQGKVAERNFRSDHDEMAAVIDGRGCSAAPRRAVFGLPHNYFFSSTKGKVDVNYAPDGGEGRRASPLLLHVHPVGEGRFVAVHTLLAARFLPEGAKVQLKTGGRRQAVPPNADWDVIREFLDRQRFTQSEGWERIHG